MKTESEAEKAKNELQFQAQDVGTVIEDLDGLRSGLKAASGQLGGLSLTIPGLGVTGQIHIVGGYTDHKASLKVAFEKVTKITVTVGVFSVAAKKTECLASIEYSDGTWTAYLGELSKEVGKKAPTTSGGKSSTTPSRASGKGSGTPSGKATP